MDLPVTAGIAAVLAGIGYAAWKWLLRRLRSCEDRLEACEERVQRAREEIAATPTPPLPTRIRKDGPP